MKKEVSMPNFIELEKGILKFWKESDAFKKLVKKNENGKRFRFLDGPVTANNRAGVHHLWGRTLKDVTLKYNAMKGKSCHFQNGFDGQGMWVEVNVEKELGLDGKPEILEYGLDKFTNKCMERVDYYANEITNQSIRMGQWMDWDNSYHTKADENITAIWHFLKECDKNGWIIKKNRPMVWCPRCGTSLSEHEMAGSYHEVTHTAIFVKLPIKNKDFKLVAWTTTPWTLTANVALAVNPEFTYVKVNFEGDNIVLGKDALKVLKKEVEIIEEFKGSELVGLEYETCFPELEEQQFTHKVVAWDMVDATEGSCVVHIAPGCGAEDFELGKVESLPEICPINDQGVMLNNCGEFAGKKTTDVVEQVVNRLKQDGKLLYAHPYKHSYPYCWRCKTDLVYKLISTWYIKMDDIKPNLLKAIEEVEFQPEYAKKRMIDWLNNMGDWNISRSRFYGLPLPFYICEKCGKVHVIGSLEELKQRAVKPELVDKLPNIHRPWIDDIEIKCECGEVVKRIPEVGDCWLDAGITPFSTKKYFTDKKFFEDNFPSDYVCEMIEQIKLWFYSMLVMSVVLTGKAPYKKVVTYQYVKDEHGNEFHKSGGNSLEADVVADQVGADTIRYLYASANPTNDMRFGFSLTDEARRKMLSFWNIYTFFNTYAVIDNPDIVNFKLNKEKLTVSDKWLLESVNNFIRNSDSNYSDYKYYSVVKEFEKLVDDISNFYIRVNRKRFWKGDDKDDQMTAYYCLYHSIKAILKVMAPIMPFLTEYIWQNLVREVEQNEVESVMHSVFPDEILNVDFSQVLKDVTIARDIIAYAQRLRNEKQIKIKQPLSTMYIIGDENVVNAVNNLESIIKDELNIKNIVIENDYNKFNDVYLGVNFRAAGAVLKGDVQKLKKELDEATNEEFAEYVKQYHTGAISTKQFKNLSSDIFVLNYKAKPEFVISTENNITIVLDITINEELMYEGLYRELVRQAQILRKEANFEIDERISMQLTTESETLQKVINKFEDKIKKEVLVISFGHEIVNPDIVKVVEVGDENIQITLKRA